jgi:hypothetical protein
MTEREIKETIAAIRMRQEERDVLLRRALSGEREALFVVAAKRKQQTEARGTPSR